MSNNLIVDIAGNHGKKAGLDMAIYAIEKLPVEQALKMLREELTETTIKEKELDAEWEREHPSRAG